MDYFTPTQLLMLAVSSLEYNPVFSLVCNFRLNIFFFIGVIIAAVLDQTCFGCDQQSVFIILPADLNGHTCGTSFTADPLKA